MPRSTVATIKLVFEAYNKAVSKEFDIPEQKLKELFDSLPEVKTLTSRSPRRSPDTSQTPTTSATTNGEVKPKLVRVKKEKIEKVQCVGFTKRGTRCKKFARPDSEYCGYHIKKKATVNEIVKNATTPRESKEVNKGETKETQPRKPKRQTKKRGKSKRDVRSMMLSESEVKEFSNLRRSKFDNNRFVNAGGYVFEKVDGKFKAVKFENNEDGVVRTLNKQDVTFLTNNNIPYVWPDFVNVETEEPKRLLPKRDK